jgi:pyridoxamine 5'-phosphate oxidase
MNLIDALIEDAGAAVLATVDDRGIPRLRWITPGTHPDHPGSIFMVTARQFAKIAQVLKKPEVSILLQTRSLDKVLNLEGKIEVLENPSIRSEMLERIGRRLNAFWKLDVPDRDLVVIEFAISSAILYLPQKGSREIITLGVEES